MKVQHWARCRNQTSSWYDWKIVEGNIKLEQTLTPSSKDFQMEHQPISHIEGACKLARAVKSSNLD